MEMDPTTSVKVIVSVTPFITPSAVDPPPGAMQSLVAAVALAQESPLGERVLLAYCDEPRTVSVLETSDTVKKGTPTNRRSVSLHPSGDEGTVITSLALVRHDIPGLHQGYQSLCFLIVGTDNGSVLFVDALVGAVESKALAVLAVFQLSLGKSLRKDYNLRDGTRVPVTCVCPTYMTPQVWGGRLPLVVSVSSSFSPTSQRHAAHSVFISGVDVIDARGQLVAFSATVLEPLLAMLQQRFRTKSPLVESTRPQLSMEWSPTSSPSVKTVFPSAGPCAEAMGSRLCESTSLFPDCTSAVIDACCCILAPTPGNLLSETLTASSGGCRSHRLAIVASSSHAISPLSLVTVEARAATALSATQLATEVASRLTTAAFRTIKGMWSRPPAAAVTPKAFVQTESLNAAQHTLPFASMRFNTVFADPSASMVAATCSSSDRVALIDVETGALFRLLKGCRRPQCEWVVVSTGATNKHSIWLLLYHSLRGVAEWYDPRTGQRMAAKKIGSGLRLLNVPHRCPMVQEHSPGAMFSAASFVDVKAMTVVHVHLSVQPTTSTLRHEGPLRHLQGRGTFSQLIHQGRELSLHDQLRALLKFDFAATDLQKEIVRRMTGGEKDTNATTSPSSLLFSAVHALASEQQQVWKACHSSGLFRHGDEGVLKFVYCGLKALFYAIPLDVQPQPDSTAASHEDEVEFVHNGVLRAYDFIIETWCAELGSQPLPRSASPAEEPSDLSDNIQGLISDSLQTMKLQHQAVHLYWRLRKTASSSSTHEVPPAEADANSVLSANSSYILSLSSFFAAPSPSQVTDPALCWGCGVATKQAAAAVPTAIRGSKRLADGVPQWAQSQLKVLPELWEKLCSEVLVEFSHEEDVALSTCRCKHAAMSPALSKFVALFSFRGRRLSLLDNVVRMMREPSQQARHIFVIGGGSSDQSPLQSYWDLVLTVLQPAERCGGALRCPRHSSLFSSVGHLRSVVRQQSASLSEIALSPGDVLSMVVLVASSLSSQSCLFVGAHSNAATVAEHNRSQFDQLQKMLQLVPTTQIVQCCVEYPIITSHGWAPEVQRSVRRQIWLRMLLLLARFPSIASDNRSMELYTALAKLVAFSDLVASLPAVVLLPDESQCGSFAATPLSGDGVVSSLHHAVGALTPTAAKTLEPFQSLFHPSLLCAPLWNASVFLSSNDTLHHLSSLGKEAAFAWSVPSFRSTVLEPIERLRESAQDSAGAAVQLAVLLHVAANIFAPLRIAFDKQNQSRKSSLLTADRLIQRYDLEMERYHLTDRGNVEAYLRCCALTARKLLQCFSELVVAGPSCGDSSQEVKEIHSDPHSQGVACAALKLCIARLADDEHAPIANNTAAAPFTSLTSVMKHALQKLSTFIQAHQYSDDMVLMSFLDVQALAETCCQLVLEPTASLLIPAHQGQASLTVPWLKLFAVPSTAFFDESCVYPILPVEMCALHDDARRAERLLFLVTTSKFVIVQYEAKQRGVAGREQASMKGLTTEELAAVIAPLGAALDLSDQDLYLVIEMAMVCQLLRHMCYENQPGFAQSLLDGATFKGEVACLISRYLRRYIYTLIKWFTGLEKRISPDDRAKRLRHAGALNKIRATMNEDFQRWVRSKPGANGEITLSEEKDDLHLGIWYNVATDDVWVETFVREQCERRREVELIERLLEFSEFSSQVSDDALPPFLRDILTTCPAVLRGIQSAVAQFR